VRTYTIGSIIVIIAIPLVPLVVGLLTAFSIVPSQEIDEIRASAAAATERLRSAYELAGGAAREELRAGLRSVESVQATATRVAVFDEQLAASLLAAGLIGAAAAIAAGVLLWLITMRRFIFPLAELAGGIERVRGGEQAVSLRVFGHPEVRYVLSSFNEMVATIERQAAQIKEFERQSVTRFLIHQFRNSLTPIDLGTQNVRQATEGALDETAATVTDEALRMIAAESGKMKRLIDEFASLTRFPEVSAATVELSQFCRSVARSFSARAGNVAVEVVPASRALPVQLDATQMEHAMGNLLQNARDALPEEGGTITVTVLEAPAVLITDDGKGMPPDQAARVFDEYYTTKRRGMGIGLSFVKRVVDAHGFHISVESSEGAGTTVRIDLSGAAEPAAHEEGQ
jgi:signal transduction histidine kinase